VNDASTDETDSRLMKYRDNPKFVILRNSNSLGGAVSRNLGVKHSTGEFITFLDDDDTYLPGHLSRLYGAIRFNNYIFVAAHRCAEKHDFAKLERIGGQKSGKIVLRDILFNNNIDIGILTSRENFWLAGGFDENLKRLQDWDLFIRLLLLGAGYRIENFGYVVNLSNGGGRITNSESAVDSYNHFIEKYENRLGGNWARVFRWNLRYQQLRINPLVFFRCLFDSCIAISGYPLRIYTLMLIKKSILAPYRYLRRKSH
jgi:glycosyltransferase involved in cell wall biosynthesis